MEKYTKKDCSKAVERLAKLLDKPTEPYVKHEDGYKAVIGAWTCDYNSVYGGAIIEEVVNDGGGIDHPMGEGRMKPYEFCRMIRGVESLIRNGSLMPTINSTLISK